VLRAANFPMVLRTLRGEIGPLGQLLGTAAVPEWLRPPQCNTLCTLSLAGGARRLGPDNEPQSVKSEPGAARRPVYRFGVPPMNTPSMLVVAGGCRRSTAGRPYLWFPHLGAKTSARYILISMAVTSSARRSVQIPIPRPDPTLVTFLLPTAFRAKSRGGGK